MTPPAGPGPGMLVLSRHLGLEAPPEQGKLPWVDTVLSCGKTPCWPQQRTHLLEVLRESMSESGDSPRMLGKGSRQWEGNRAEPTSRQAAGPGLKVPE